MEEKVLEIIKNVLEQEVIDMDCSQDNCEKWDSMAVLNIVIDIQDAFDVSFEPEEIANLKSVKAIVSVLREKLS